MPPTVALAARDVGAGPAVVLLHALPLSAAMWLGQREGLSSLCRVITPDQRGFGGSPLGEGAPSLDACADDLAALLDVLEVDRVVLGGVSMGASVAVRFLARHPHRVAALLLAGTTGRADTPEAAAARRALADEVELRRSTALTEARLPHLLGATSQAHRAHVVSRVEALAHASAPPAVAWALRALAERPDAQDVLRTVDVPAVVVHGAEDQLTTREQAQAVADLVPGGRLQELAGCGHLSPLEVPEAFSDVVLELVRAVG